jgi:hypothetical protein
VSDRKREPTDADGPLFREAHRRAGEVDSAQTPQERRAAKGGFFRAAAVALAEGFLREAVIWGAVLFSVLAAVFGATSGSVAWAIPMVIAGVAGAVVVFVAVARKWTFGAQWAAFMTVLIVEIALIVALWQTH